MTSSALRGAILLLRTDHGPALRAIALAFAPVIAFAWAVWDAIRRLDAHLIGFRAAGLARAITTARGLPSAGSAPVEPAPVGSAPVEPAPVGSAPVEPAPVGSAPVGLPVAPEGAESNPVDPGDVVLEAFALAVGLNEQLLDQVQHVAATLSEQPNSVVEIVLPSWAETLSDPEGIALMQPEDLLQRLEIDIEIARSLLALRP